MKTQSTNYVWPYTIVFDPYPVWHKYDWHSSWDDPWFYFAQYYGTHILKNTNIETSVLFQVVFLGCTCKKTQPINLFSFRFLGFLAFFNYLVETNSIGKVAIHLRQDISSLWRKFQLAEPTTPLKG